MKRKEQERKKDIREEICKIIFIRIRLLTSDANPITEFRDRENTAHNRSDSSVGSMFEYTAMWRIALECTTLINLVSAAIALKILNDNTFLILRHTVDSLV